MLTLAENKELGQSAAAINARKKTCKFGHSDWVPRKGGRRCRTCRIRESREQAARARRKE